MHSNDSRTWPLRRPAAIIIATLTILIWAVTGPVFNYSEPGSLS
nr:low affinity iron permease family protein [Mucilaginibacter sp. E4BP6]